METFHGPYTDAFYNAFIVRGERMEWIAIAWIPMHHIHEAEYSLIKLFNS